MLQPKRTQHRKIFRLRSQSKGIATRGALISFGEIGIKALEAGELTARQIEAARRVITRSVKRGGKVWIRVFPDKVLTAKGAEVPMGSGKGAPDKWVTQVKPGKIIFEMAGADPEMMRKALKLAIYKLPIKCKVITPEI
ncbi:50S ribosomal protein L16 [bacterium]|jgi:large subunit ribosomal protein L16|nr:50S ribosomal protein L16 [bacterium]MBT6831526.1 50S ribosomal protein L16 [bacterium]MBT6996177.1 50S ribosomal protein L16 [bacterium]MBT7772559.1 50S ribosomal protein L16 [bacterium]